MLRRTAVLVLGFAGLLGSPAGAFGQQPASDRSESALASPLLAGHPRLAASLDRITRGSSLWRAEVDALGRAGRRALILTSDQVAMADPQRSLNSRPFDAGVLAEVALLPDEASRIDTVLVVVNLALFDEVHDRRGSFAPERDADLDRILVHEVYGHAFPYLIAGDATGRCADPSAGERPADACSIQRENAVRAELGLGRRADYGLGGLNLGQPGGSASGLVLSTRMTR
jgi:hypothetical protein